MATLPDNALPHCTNPQHPPALPRRMIRTYTMRLKVTRRQDETLQRLLVQLCELYNMALQQRRDVWKSHRLAMSLNAQYRQLTELRHGLDEYAEFPVDVQRDALLRVDRTFKHFFRRFKRGERTGYPRFFSYSRYDSFNVPKGAFSLNSGGVRVAKLGVFRAKTRCKLRGTPLELRVKRCGNSWTAQVVADIGAAPDKVTLVDRSVGIDLGLTSLAVLSDGQEISNPRWARQADDKLAGANRALERKEKGSNNRCKALAALRKVYKAISGRRRAYLHAVSKYLLEEYDLVAYEDLKIRNLMRSSSLSRSIMDAAWGELIHQLKYKAEWAGKYAVAVDPRGTTQRCSGCGEKVPKNLGDRWHNCHNCGLSLNRDHNAALNILALGESAVARQKG